MPRAWCENRNPLLDDPIFRRFFGVPGGGRASRCSARSAPASSSTPSGLIVTNNHVIEGADEVKVSLSDKREFEAEIVLKDPRTDLAVLRIKDGSERFPSLEFANSDELQVGDLVLAIGNPFGVGQTVTHGIVSALARTQVGITDYQFFIQTDAAINPGNSGGALVDIDGRLVGINTAIFSRSGGSHGIGFAIPANMVRVVVASAAGGGKRGAAALARRQAAGGDARHRREPGPEAPGRRAGRRASRRTARRRRPASKTGDLIVVGRRAGGRRSQRLRLSLRAPSRSAAARSSALLRGGQGAARRGRAADRAGDCRARRSSSSRARRSSAPRSATCRRRWRTNCGSMRRSKASSSSMSATARPPQSVGFQRGDVIVAVNGEQDRARRATWKSVAERSRSRVWRITIDARRAADCACSSGG